MNVQLLWQKDPRWANIRLGKGSATIASDGCIVTSMAMMTGLLPPDVNRRLLMNNEFSGSNVTIANINYGKVFDNGIIYDGQSAWFDNPVTAIAMNVLRSYVRDVGVAILCLDARPEMKGMQYHYLLAIGVADDGEIIVNDPWYNVTDKLNQINRVWYKRIFRGIYGETSEKAIYRYDMFRKECHAV